MAGQYTISQVLNYIFDVHHNDEKGRGQENVRMDLRKKKGTEDRMEYNPDQETTDVELRSDDVDHKTEVAVTFKSKNGDISWSSFPPDNQGRLST